MQLQCCQQQLGFTKQSGVSLSSCRKFTCRTSRKLVVSVMASSSQATIKPSEALVGGEKEKWLACKALIGSAGADEELAERALARAFGWTDRYYWQNEIVDQVPSTEQVRLYLHMQDFQREEVLL